MEQSFGTGVDINKPRRVSSEFACAGIMYLCLLVQVILSIVILASKNSEVVAIESTSSGYILNCPGNLVLISSCVSTGFGSTSLYGTNLCVKSSVCDEARTCTANGRRLTDSEAVGASFADETTTQSYYRALAAEEGPAPRSHLYQRRLAQRILQGQSSVPKDVWSFLEEHAHQPVVLLLCVAVLSFAWMFFIYKAPKAAIWGVVAIDILLCIAVFIWFKVDFDVWNVGAAVVAVFMIAGAVLLRQKINGVAVVMGTAMEGLAQNKRIFGVGFAIQLAWIAFFALWVAGIVARHFVVEVGAREGSWGCEVRMSGALGSNGLAAFFVVVYYWVTFFCHNVNLMMVTANLSGWYFKEEGYAGFWVKALRWSVFEQAGGNAMASAIMGASEYCLDRIKSTGSLIFSGLNPLHWVFVCIAMALKTVLMTYSKMGLIAMTYSGETLCGVAPKAFQMLTGRLGQALLTDYLGQRVMEWATYVISVGVGFAAWAWADDAQGVSGLRGIEGTWVLILILVFAYVLSYPFATLVMVVLLEQAIGEAFTQTPEVRAILNSVFAALFLGSITMYLMSYISRIVVNAGDVLFFCFAVEVSMQQKQERFEKLYQSIKENIADGGVQGQNVAMGTGQASGQAAPPPAAQPTVVGNVVEQP